MSRKIWGILKKWVSGGASRVPLPTQAEICRQTIGVCPLCKESLSGHGIAWLCSVKLNGGSHDRRRHVEQLIEAGKWTEVQAFQEWRAEADNLEYRVLRCPAAGLAMLVLVSPYEPQHLDWLDVAWPLPSESNAELEQLLQSKWLAL